MAVLSSLTSLASKTYIMLNTSINNNSRIAKNTIFLYFRMILLMAVSLYTSRVVLATLGIEDYGVYNVVGGFIGMLGFLNGAMSGSTQRFITIELGRGDVCSLQKVFSTCVITHALIAVIIFVIAETIGLWFVLEKMVIPDSRMIAAFVVYQCSVITSIVQIMSYPYNADIIAHEEMSAFAYISIYEAIANLAVALLIKVENFDRLMLYAGALLVVKISVTLIYMTYCKRHFIESTVKKIFDKSLIKQMFAFTGWNLWGGMAGTLMGQGINVLLNLFFGPAVNAARGLAVQVQSAVQMFAVNFQMAMNPQIMKTYATGEMNAMHSLIFRSAKFSFILLLCIMLPLVTEINTVLHLWLEHVPEYTNIFIALTLCICMIDSVSNPFMTASAATGKVKVYQSVVGGILLSIVPIAYIVLKLGGKPYSVFIVNIIIAMIAFMARLVIVKKLIDFSIRKYVFQVVVPCMTVLLPSALTAVVIKHVIPSGLIYSFANMILVVIVTVVVSFILGLSKNERNFILEKVKIVKK